MARDHEVRFCESFDGARIAYATAGDGYPVVLLPSWLSHLDHQRRSVAWAPFLDALAARYRLIRYDPRGCGLSDRRVMDLGFEAWVRDLDALVGHLRLGAFALLGVCQGGAVAVEYAARNPGRVSHLVLFGTYARGRDKRGDLPLEPEKARVMLEMMRLGWGSDDHGFATAFAKQFQPDGGEEHLRSWCELQRRAAAPETAVALTRIMYDLDIRTALPLVACPTLVVHANRDAVVPFEEGRLLARMIPRARFVELDSRNHFLRTDEVAWEQFTEALTAFLPAVSRHDRFGDLTPREMEVLSLVAEGRDNREIARALGLREKTVRNHVSNLFVALGVANRPRLIVAARQGGLGLTGQEVGTGVPPSQESGRRTD